jgi:hypothetical protein
MSVQRPTLPLPLRLLKGTAYVAAVFLVPVLALVNPVIAYAGTFIAVMGVILYLEGHLTDRKRP